MTTSTLARDNHAHCDVIVTTVVTSFLRVNTAAMLSKNGVTKLVAVTSSNLNRFFKLFYHWILI